MSKYHHMHARELRILRRMVRSFPLQLLLQKISIKESIGLYAHKNAEHIEDLNNFSHHFMAYLRKEVQTIKSDYLATSILLGILTFVLMGFIMVHFTRRVPFGIIVGKLLIALLPAMVLFYFLYKFFNARALLNELKKHQLYISETTPSRKILTELYDQVEPLFDMHGFHTIISDLKDFVAKDSM